MGDRVVHCNKKQECKDIAEYRRQHRSCTETQTHTGGRSGPWFPHILRLPAPFGFRGEPCPCIRRAHDKVTDVHVVIMHGQRDQCQSYRRWREVQIRTSSKKRSSLDLFPSAILFPVTINTSSRASKTRKAGQKGGGRAVVSRKECRNSWVSVQTALAPPQPSCFFDGSERPFPKTPWKQISRWSSLVGVGVGEVGVEEGEAHAVELMQSLV